MLSTLRLKNLGIVDELEIDFASGMNVLTGETGAGKSLVLKGLSLLAGGRASGDFIRHGAEKAEIEGVFRISETVRAELSELHDWLGDSIVDDELVLRRIVDASGRGKISIAGRLSTRGELESIAPYLLEITGQHAQQRLLDEDEHLKFLDAFGTPEDLLADVRTKFDVFAHAKRTLDSFLAALSTEQETERRLRLEFEELSKAQLRAGEKESLLQELGKLSSVEMLGATCTEVLTLLDDESYGISLLTSKAVSSLEKALKHDPHLSELAQMARQVEVEVDELRRGMNDYLSRLEADPERAEWIRERCSDIAKLERRYARSEAELVEYFLQLQQSLQRFENKEVEEKRMRAELALAEKELNAVEERLTAIRAKSAKKLEKEIEVELKAVGITKGIFRVELARKASSELGCDRALFTFSANPGQPPRPFAEVASGGELSRVLLVLKAVAHGKRLASVQVFDEIDTGVGGATAQMVGERILSISKSSQVILVTHAPQIASIADAHFEISKRTKANETSVKVDKLSGEQRVHEVARMLAGKQVSAKFVDSARELLAGR